MPSEDHPSLPPEQPPAPASRSATDPSVEEHAWAELVMAWSDEAAHKAYLARFPDLQGLALAGRRYRAVLVERPGDPMAERFRDEVVKRATVVGLSQLPRTAPPPPIPRWLKLAIAYVIAGLLATTAWKLFSLFSSSPAP